MPINSFRQKLIGMKDDPFYHIYLSSKTVLLFLDSFSEEPVKTVLEPSLLGRYAERGMREMSNVFVESLKRRLESATKVTPLFFLESALECEKMMVYWGNLPIFFHHLPDMVFAGLSQVKVSRAKEFSETIRDAIEHLGFYEMGRRVTVPLVNRTFQTPPGWEIREMEPIIQKHQR